MSLDVYLFDVKIGRLEPQTGTDFSFQYTRNWLNQPGAIPLSLSLPLQKEPVEAEKSRPYFANLLPEAGVRTALARYLGISENNDYAVLEAIGGECAGAVSVLPKGKKPATKGQYQAVVNQELKGIVTNLSTRPFLAGEKGVRLSLAGAQNKLPVYIKDNQIYLPLGNKPSSHIIKPAIKEYASSVENETFCMLLAAEMGLNVPNVGIYDDYLFVIERYDRIRNKGGSINRIHQEDMCQALGIVPDQKYEKEGGPSLQKCFAFLRDISVQPAKDIRRLLNWVIFNYLIANADAQAKNISLLLLNDGPRLAPFYDLMCTKVYDGLTDRLAMKIGGEDRPNWVIARKWMSFAQEIGIRPTLVRRRATEMATDITDVSSQVEKKFADTYGEKPVIKQIKKIITDRSKKLLRSMKAGV
jgi:serine/threonine-protein kinase HipA